MIISLLQTKGGTAKTTLAKCLAYSQTFKKAFKSIALIELDAQESINLWYSQRSEKLKKQDKTNYVLLLENETDSLKDKLKKLNTQYELLILDVPGESIGRFATHLGAYLSDIVLVPMRSSTNDEASFEKHILPIIDKVVDKYPNKKESFFIVPTFVPPQASPENISNYFNEVMPSPMKCLKSVLPTRSVYENFSREGLSLLDYAKAVKKNARSHSQVQKAITDIEKIAKEILLLAN